METENHLNKNISDLQHPVRSGFGAFTTAQEVIKGIDLTGKTAIVTGGYSGIGFETVKALHSAGATVIVPVRNKAKVKELFSEFTSRIELEEMDLMDPPSIDAFAEKFLSTQRPLHILINNAGIMASPLVRDKRGYESQFATNHLGHFQLTVKLWPALLKAKGARVIAVSSLGHRFSPVIFEDPNFEHRPYDRWLAYGQSKTANVLFALELDRIGKQHGIRAFSLHPGRIIETNLKKYLSTEELKAAGALDKNGEKINSSTNPLKTIEQGASTSIWCATSPALNNMGGVYCANCDIAELMNVKKEEVENVKNASEMSGVLPFAVDYNNAQALWTLSEKLTGLRLL